MKKADNPVVIINGDNNDVEVKVTVTETSPPSPLDGDTVHQSLLETFHGLLALTTIVVEFPSAGAFIEFIEIDNIGPFSQEYSVKSIKVKT